METAMAGTTPHVLLRLLRRLVSPEGGNVSLIAAAAAFVMAFAAVSLSITAGSLPPAPSL